MMSMVQSIGLEPMTSSFAGRRSNPTELRLHRVTILLEGARRNQDHFDLSFRL